MNCSRKMVGSGLHSTDNKIENQPDLLGRADYLSSVYRTEANFYNNSMDSLLLLP